MMTSYDALRVPSYSPTVDITSLLRSWCSPGDIDKITMAHVRLDMIAVDSLVQPRLERLNELESEVAHLRAELDLISPILDKYHSFHGPIRRVPPEVLLSIFSHLKPGPLPLKDDAPWVLTRVCSSWRDNRRPPFKRDNERTRIRPPKSTSGDPLDVVSRPLSSLDVVWHTSLPCELRVCPSSLWSNNRPTAPPVPMSRVSLHLASSLSSNNSAASLRLT
ncbi:hypothetical protein EDD85DRAFT_502264 [Armillaria nabsnona]|nr:hypothetical protein EDD85DRAFT_502264 [Armillaria nabsnona]